MSPNKAGSDDWLSAPVGAKQSSAESQGSSTGTDDTVVAPSASSASKYKSSFTNNISKPASDSVYPADTERSDAQSPAVSAPMDPGPATSIGLGSSATGMQNATGTQSAVKSKSGRRPSARGPRRAKLQIRHIDPWSTLKLSLVLAIAFFFVWMVAVGILYGVLSGMGVFDSVNSLFNELGTKGSSSVVSPKIIFGGAALIGAVNIVLFTALSTIGAYIYNLCADLAGGLEITLAERR